jgi:hypothetical protein
MPAFRNLFIMRQLLLLAVFISALPLARAAETASLTTNTVVVGEQGTLEISSPKDWTFIQTNLNYSGKPISVELHSPGNTAVIRLTIFWDGFRGPNVKPTEADMEKTVSTVAPRRYLPISVEKTFTLEKLQGPAVTGPFVRFTDAGWTPPLTDEFQNVATGMFRSGNLWGNFDLYTNEKDGPNFKQGLQVLKSLRRKP